MPPDTGGNGPARTIPGFFERDRGTYKRLRTRRRSHLTLSSRHNDVVPHPMPAAAARRTAQAAA